IPVTFEFTRDFRSCHAPQTPIPGRPRLYTATSQDKITRSETCIPHMRCSASVVVPAYQESG
ncbi:hypothetical protein EV363DRAFT_1158767, partial [Boletus edulis]